MYSIRCGRVEKVDRYSLPFGRVPVLNSLRKDLGAFCPGKQVLSCTRMFDIYKLLSNYLKFISLVLHIKPLKQEID